MESCTAVAYPGLPLIFAEGFRDYGNRTSMHSHASLALTGTNGGVNTKTTVSLAETTSFTIDGRTPSGPRSKGVYELATIFISMSGMDAGVVVESVNNSIYSGSSDSGAAAVSSSLNHLLGLGLSKSELSDHARRISETAYRSIYGGLSEYFIDKDGVISTDQALDDSVFSDVRILACPFDYDRYSADELHLKVVEHPDYHSRISQVNDRMLELKQLSRKEDVEGILCLMESEAKTVHGLFEGVGLTVIKPLMKAVCSSVESMRSEGVPAFWNVAGGSVVYVFTFNDSEDRVKEALSGLNVGYDELKVAGPARVMI
ncbi:MAG: hypothetical protein ABIH11_04000 [Candidatus Altiarchaeota archaeon]